MNHKRRRPKNQRAGCLYTGCDRPHCARGWCNTHYQQVVVAGKKPMSIKVTLSLKERLEARTEKSDGCWLWGGAKTDRGYGLIGDGGNLFHTHRVAWELEFGPIEDGKEVCHECDVRHCIRPDHLFVADHRTNMIDMAKKGRAAHKKLSVEQVRKIRKEKERGLSHKELAERYGVSKSSIKSVVSRRNYAWVD